MEEIHISLKCTECKCILEKPVVLPCGDCICQRHVKQDSNEYTCLVCDIIHPVPRGGFCPVNALERLIKAKFHTMKFPPEYESTLKSLRDFEKLLDQLEVFKKDPYYSIYASIADLKSETDLLREEFKLRIDEQADGIIQELNKYERVQNGESKAN
jgi:hypothetical protein